MCLEDDFKFNVIQMNWISRDKDVALRYNKTEFYDSYAQALLESFVGFPILLKDPRFRLDTRDSSPAPQ